MALALILSSHVAASRVGGFAQALALAQFKVDAVLAPTVLYGRHPGWGPPGGAEAPAEVFESVLDGIDAIKVCVGYRLDGTVIQHLPAGQTAQAAVEPVYETFPGWTESTRGARSWADLPANAVKYVRRLEELIETPVSLLSTSPERDDTILVSDPLQD